jgi:polar amino acid transport system substrate-binding protein
VVNGIEINEERAKRVAFSTPYYQYEQQLTVRAEDKGKYRTLDDLKGHKVATLNAAEANNVLKRAGWTEQLISPYDDSLTPYNELKLGRVEAVLQESIIADYYAGKDAKLYNVPQTFSPGKYAVALRKEDASLLQETDRILNLMKQNGELAAIYVRWKLWNDGQAALGIQEASTPKPVPGPAPAKAN